ncbi:hypothetical protein HYV10_03345 [Candidatus Dependentiae bacterium]|nr:hypothetical protein [Candidatus Dependentiae bacterium]
MNKKLFIALNLISAISFASCDKDCNSSNDCNSCCAQSINLWQPHAFEAYSSRDIIQKRTFFTNESHRQEGYQGFFSTAVEYMQNFGGKCDTCNNLGARPFWSGTNTMTYGTNNGESNVDAYQFGMGNVTGQGTIQLSPKIQHVGADMMLYFTRRKDERGLFFSVKAPLGAMSIKSQLTEEPVASPDGNPVVKSDDYWLIYPSPAARYQTLTQAWQAGQYSGDEVVSSRHKVLAITQGRIADCKQTVIRMADLTAVLGYKVYGSEKGFVDIGFKVTCPTGNVPTGQFVFEPVFGRAGHWFVGGEVAARYKVYESDSCMLDGVDFWMQADVGHLFAGRRPDWRSFDLKQNGPGSKYLLIQHYFPGNPTEDNPSGRIPSFVTNAVNVTTVPVKSKFAVEGTFAAAFDFYKNNWNLMIGGEFWGRSKECLSFDCCNIVKERVANLNDYAVLGRQVSEVNSSADGSGTTTSLNLCEPLAKINKSQDAHLSPDNLPEGVVSALDAANRIPSSLSDALDVQGAASAAAMTGKLFGQFGYTFKEHHYTPNLSFIAGAEFNAKGDNAVSLWSVGLQGSLNF